jgi:hypothetical protein
MHRNDVWQGSSLRGAALTLVLGLTACQADKSVTPSQAAAKVQTHKTAAASLSKAGNAARLKRDQLLVGVILEIARDVKKHPEKLGKVRGVNAQSQCATLTKIGKHYGSKIDAAVIALGFSPGLPMETLLANDPSCRRERQASMFGSPAIVAAHSTSAPTTDIEILADRVVTDSLSTAGADAFASMDISAVEDEAGLNAVMSSTSLSGMSSIDAAVFWAQAPGVGLPTYQETVDIATAVTDSLEEDCLRENESLPLSERIDCEQYDESAIFVAKFFEWNWKGVWANAIGGCAGAVATAWTAGWTFAKEAASRAAVARVGAMAFTEAEIAGGIAGAAAGGAAVVAAVEGAVIGAVGYTAGTCIGGAIGGVTQYILSNR